MSNNKILLLNKLKEESYKEGKFKLSSGKESDYFIDCKKTLLTAAGHVLVAEEIYHKQLPKFDEEIDAIAGVVLGGCSIASAISTYSFIHGYSNVIHALYIRKESKDHGTKNLIEGNVAIPANVVLVEDVVTSGESSLKAATILKEFGYNILGIVSVVDRLEGGRQNIENAGIKFFSIFDINDFKL